MFIPRHDTPAAALDQGMRNDLAQSLERLGAMAAAVLPVDADLKPALAHIRGHRIEPGLFARYYDLVFALQAKAHARAGALWREIIALAPEEPQLRLVAYAPRALGADAERFGRLLAIGSARAPRFCEPTDEAWRHFEATAPAALQLLEAAHPAWASEVRQLVVRIIAAAPEAAPGAVAFTGGSSMMAWGAILVNVREARDRLEVLSVIAHEATHLLLFGLSRNELLVANPVEELYRTELRPTPRPMNALYHSTYVSGRMSWLSRMLLARCAQDLSAAERASLDQTAELQRRRFDQGHEVIRRHGRLTPLGLRLIEEAREAMLSREPAASPQR
jgi:HEXXH motif-containing protein